MTELQTLIERWRSGDEKAAATIYDLHKTKAYRLAYGLVGNKEDAEEAAQDALTYALFNIHHFDKKRSKFSTWLYTITVSRCRDIQRKRRLPVISFAEWLRNFSEKKSKNPTPEQQIIVAEERESIWRSIQRLSPPLREAIVLRHWGGHTYQEIAEIVGCPIRTAQSRVRLAYGQLARTLTASDPEIFLREVSS